MRARTLPLLLLATVRLASGPPYLTDDPEPVETHRWEGYLFAQGQRLQGIRSGLGPALEVNYGPFRDAQIQVQVPLAFAEDPDGRMRRGLGDAQVGFKYRFLGSGEGTFQAAVYPQVQLPTGRDSDDLGAGHVRVLLPLWLQARSGAWTTYGGGGWWRNPGAGNRDYAIFGWLVQREVAEGTSLGLEVFRQEPATLGGRAVTTFDVGGELHLTERFQLVASAGRTLSGPSGGQAYLGLRGHF